MNAPHADPPKRSRLGIVAALILVAAVFVTARRYRPDDAPFSPHDDAEILEHVAPGTGADPAADELRRLEAALARAPNDLSIAARVARMHIDAARRDGDARRLSYAEAALAPWWKESDVPVEALVLRATIKQSRHEFRAALVDLDLATRAAPGEAQAWLTRATVLGVLARYDEARQSCARLRGLAAPLVEIVCTAEIDAVTGRGAEARTRLSTALTAPGISPTEAAWARSVRGEAALYAGDVAAAETDLRAALATDGKDAYTRGLFADLLLDAQRPAEVLVLVPADETNEVLLLRRAIAARRTGPADAASLRDKLRARVDELRARGDVTHRREEARLVLEVEGDARAALPIAAADFEQQEEPWDARILLEAAAAAAPAQRAGALAAARPAIAWAEESRCAWPPLVHALAVLKAAP